MYGNTKICRKTLYFRKYCTSVHVHVLAGGGWGNPGVRYPGKFRPTVQYVYNCTCTFSMYSRATTYCTFVFLCEDRIQAKVSYRVLSYTRTDDEGTFEDRYLRTRYNGTCVYCTFVRRYESTFVLPYEDRQNTFVHTKVDNTFVRTKVISCYLRTKILPEVQLHVRTVPCTVRVLPYMSHSDTLFRPGIEVVYAVSSRFMEWDKRQVRFDQNNNIFISHVPTVSSAISMQKINRMGSVSPELRVGKPEARYKVVVIKVGTSSLLRKGHLHLSLLGALAETCADLTNSGFKVIVVTSGAVGAGCQVLGTTVRNCSNPGGQHWPLGFVRVSTPH
jgi:hypothetical protein